MLSEIAKPRWVHLMSWNFGVADVGLTVAQIVREPARTDIRIRTIQASFQAFGSPVLLRANLEFCYHSTDQKNGNQVY